MSSLAARTKSELSPWAAWRSAKRCLQRRPPPALGVRDLGQLSSVGVAVPRLPGVGDALLGQPDFALSAIVRRLVHDPRAPVPGLEVGLRLVGGEGRVSRTRCAVGHEASPSTRPNAQVRHHPHDLVLQPLVGVEAGTRVAPGVQVARLVDPGVHPTQPDQAAGQALHEQPVQAGRRGP